MTAASPYRTRPAPVSTTSMPVLAVPRALALVLAVLLVAPALLHVFLWSRVVTVQCARDARAAVTCEVDEASIALSSHRQVDVTGAIRATAVGALHRSRGDVHVEVERPGGPGQLTSGFNGDKAAQIRLAEDLTRFFQQAGRREVTLSFGDRWRAAWIFLVIDSVVALILAPIFGQRFRVTADRERDTLEVQRRIGPIPGKRTTLPLSRVLETRVLETARGRYQIVAVTVDPVPVPLTWKVGAPSFLEPTSAALTAFLAQERARYRAGDV